ncbi:hypothetical protein FQN54_007829 [Arachnomyces sp. PD_36]|nr:hypothetical protein FQN54_007829 [Arachnomyces sp. PD_36]
MASDFEKEFAHALQKFPKAHNYRYTKQAVKDLLQLLFQYLTGSNEEYLRLLFTNGPPSGPWKLAEAQGAREGAEYSESARGKRCGHIFKAGEASYRCSTCTSDDTCVLCSRCWDASDHTGHSYSILLSSGNCGCCDCGDDEAWRLPLFCAIHTDTGESKEKKGKQKSQIPNDFIETMRMTIARVFDYFCDVISCSPEQLRLPKSEEGIKQDEVVSRLSPEWYGDGDADDEEPEYAVVLWNDEKHTIKEVTEQVARACRERHRFGEERANETHETGRSMVKYSRDLDSLLGVSKIIEQIKVTVTVRSSRDTFREQMCGTMIEWLLDIAGCNVGDDNEILRQIVCEEMLKPWRKGSAAYNAGIGRMGIDDHEQDEATRVRTLTLTIAPQAQLFAQMDSDDDELEGEVIDNDDERDEDEDEDDEGHDDLGDEGDDDDDDQMELDIQGIADEIENDPDDPDIDMGTAEDELEIAEATIAGYPPPPPPPPRPQRVQPAHPVPEQPAPPVSQETEAPSAARHIAIPKTPGPKVKVHSSKTPRYWESRSPRYRERSDLPAHEDLWQRTRLDWMILFDLRLWKQARTDLRDLYISTVVNIPQFKRILGLRFSALYTALAQLYLIADREPDHSIVNLSLQLLTTPSITEEVVERGNFLTNIIAILYTFLTTRQVGEPQDVSSTATLAFDAGSVTNRRLYHFFADLKYLLQSGYVQQRIRTEDRYLLQFLDLVKLPQGICPNVRAVGEHVEYETDAWISASILMREINRLCRQFCESFRNLQTPEDEAGLFRAISAAAVSTIVNSVGAERKRFDQAEIKDVTRFKSLPCFDFEVDTSGQIPRHRVVDFVVEKGSISFHHALHYTLSWLLECGKSMSRETMRDILFQAAIDAREQHFSRNAVQLRDPEDIALAMFDYPLRVCAWLAQMKAGMWVRNGLSLRHQMSQYRGVSLRDVAYYRDIFLLQSALVTCNPSRVLASIADRFGMVDWMSRNYMVRAGYEDTQLVDIAEEFVHLLLILLTDRTCLTADDDESNTRNVISRDIAHVLCFKQLSFSDLSTRLSDRLLEADGFQDVLDEVAIFRAPEGLNDTGTFELKPEYIELVDPYSAHYTKNQRDEAENIYKNWMAKKTGKKASDIVFEPKLRPISRGAFSDLPAFTKTPVFAQIIHHCLDYSLSSRDCTPNIPMTRVEAFLQVVLHLTLVSTIEDETDEDEMAEDSAHSFVANALSKTKMTSHGNLTVIALLQKISNVEEFQPCSPKIRHILKKFWQKRPRMYMATAATLKFPYDRIDADSPANAGESEMEQKKKQALDRQARVMAQFQQQQQNFMNNQSGIDWGEDDLSDLESELRDTTETKLWKYPTGTCILCQEDTTDSRLYGTFALVADSGILRQTDVGDPDFVREALNTGSSLDRSAEGIRPFGVAGENREKVRRLDSMGREVVNEKQGLSKGFPSHQAIRGPVTTGCGHIMHFSCFEVYYNATERRHSHQVSRNHPERTGLKEFVCPLCKALGNAFLPIIWKGKEESYPGVLSTAQPLDQFINHELVTALHKFRIHALLADSDKLLSPGYQDVFVDYVSKNMITPISSRIEHLMTHNVSSALGFAHPPRMAMPGVYPTTDDVTSTSPLHQVSTPNDSPVTELVAIYKRLRETLRTNQIQSNFTYPPNSITTEDLIYSDALVKSFGHSISALEISQRGVEASPGPTLLDKIPPLTLTHLRILAESSFSYASIGGLHNAVSNRTVYEFREMHRRKLCQLFVGHNGLTGLDNAATGNSPIWPLLTQDTFIMLAECSLSLVPVLNVDIHHIVHICYVAEILKVILAYIIKPQGLGMELEKNRDKYLPESNSESEEQLSLARGFFDWIRSRMRDVSNPNGTGYAMFDHIDPPTELLLMFKRLASTYALPFLRKTTILLHVQHGLEFPEAAGLIDPSISELDRLTKLLRLPSIDEIFASFTSGEDANAVDQLATGWLSHWNTYNKIPHRPRMADGFPPGLSLPHPAIFELVGLPKYFDMLMEEANRRRCPNTGKELSDPSICLFCGAIFCSQAVCCLRNKLGGCNQHLDRCGKNIGLFINIRKCMVLYLVNRNGSWHYAPYLDRHGEVDPGLRRSRQLILNQKRYDRLLRDVWLSHSIPATVSRKLESEINNGGWESV